MSKYYIAVQETLERIVEVDAKTEDEAIDLVQELYDKESIVLDASDRADTWIGSAEAGSLTL